MVASIVPRTFFDGRILLDGSRSWSLSSYTPDVAPLNLIAVRTGTWEFERQTEFNIGLDSEAFGRRVLGGKTHYNSA